MIKIHIVRNNAYGKYVTNYFPKYPMKLKPNNKKTIYTCNFANKDDLYYIHINPKAYYL